MSVKTTSVADRIESLRDRANVMRRLLTEPMTIRADFFTVTETGDDDPYPGHVYATGSDAAVGLAYGMLVTMQRELADLHREVSREPEPGDHVATA